MARKFITVEEYLGRRLTGGSYYQWMVRMMEIIATIVTDNQQFASAQAEMTPLLEKLSLLIRQAGAFADTPAVKNADKWRDSMFTVVYWHIYYCSLLPDGSSLSAAGKKLYPQVKPYKSLQGHEMTQETTEIAGFIRVLTQEANQSAVAALGLTVAVQELGEQNDIIQTEMEKREAEDDARKQLKDGETTATLRAKIEPVYEVIVQIVNALVVMGNESATAAVPLMNAAIDHYQQIEAQKGGKSGSSSSQQGGTSSNGNNGSGESGSSEQGGGGEQGGSEQGGGLPPSGGGEVGDDNGGSSSEQGGSGDNGGGLPPSGGGEVGDNSGGGGGGLPGSGGEG